MRGHFLNMGVRLFGDCLSFKSNFEWKKRDVNRFCFFLLKLLSRFCSNKLFKLVVMRVFPHPQPLSLKFGIRRFGWITVPSEFLGEGSEYGGGRRGLCREARLVVCGSETRGG